MSRNQQRLTIVAVALALAVVVIAHPVRCGGDCVAVIAKVNPAAASVVGLWAGMLAGEGVK